MIDEGFYFFDNGSIGELRGFRRVKVSQDEQQRLLDNNSREKMYAFTPPSGLSPAEYNINI